MPSAILEPTSVLDESSIHRFPGTLRRISLSEGIRLLTCASIGLAFLAYVLFTWHWRIAVDTPVMHYVVFLMKHGLAPYSDITDNNMPGTYLTEAIAMAVFGGSDLAWRVYEFVLMALYLGCAAYLTRTWHWTCGLFGAGVFLVMHSAEGPQLAVERELLIGVLTAVACVLLFRAIDRDRPLLLLSVGVLSGTAASIKPTYLFLTCALLCLAVWRACKLQRSPMPFFFFGGLGLLLAFGADLAFLLHFHALRGFAFILTDVLPAYHHIAPMHWYVLIFASMPWFVAALTFVSAPLSRANRNACASPPRVADDLDIHEKHHDWRWGTLVIVAAFGLISFFAQGKGYIYHRYVFLMFLLPLVGVELFTAIAKPGWPRWLALVSVGCVFGFLFPSRLLQAKAVVGQSTYELTLEQDLQHLSDGSPLTGKVQCFDMVYGCLNALYHLDVVENSGFTGDMLLFPAIASTPSRFYQQRFWRLAKVDPATILVIGNGIIGQPNSESKLDRWPEFRDYLASHYQLVVERHFLHARYGYETPFTSYAPSEADGYQIYQSRDTHNGR